MQESGHDLVRLVHPLREQGDSCVQGPGGAGPDTALSRAQLGLASGPLFKHLLADGVIKAAPPDRFYLDVTRQSRYLLNRRWTIAAVAAGLVGIAVVLAAIRS